MGRKSAAQIAQEELEKAKAAQAEKEKTTSGSAEGEISQTGTITQEEVNDATSGDSGTDNGGNNEPEPPALPEKEKVHAVALRDLPGVGVKVGRIIFAPENMIKAWGDISWVDTHEDALTLAEQRWTQQKMANPMFGEPKIYELDAKGQIMESSDKE